MKGGTILGVLLLSSIRTTLWKEGCGKASAMERLIPLVAVEKCIRLAIPALVWTALEKTHGCNFMGGKV